MKRKIHRIKNALLPCVLLSAITGVVAGILILLFKLTVSKVTALSEQVYHAVRQRPILLPLLLLGAILLGLIVSYILKKAKQCRGGGIPTAVASIRGLVPLRWLQSIFVLFISAMLTYLCGVPLGSEGPSVQMGTAVGKGSSDTLTKKNMAWERYLMTGGACAGFATALGAPLTGILFAVEEIHRRFSPMIFTAAATSVFTATVTQEILAGLLQVDVALFHFPKELDLPLHLLWLPIIIGGLCGLMAILFTKFYRFIRTWNAKSLKKIPLSVKVVLIFAASAILGFLCEDFIGSGHALIEKILHGHTVWYLLLAAFVIRALLMLTANCSGITGGMFIPILTFGAIVSALIAGIFSALGLVDPVYLSILIAIGMASFLAAAYRTPLAALAFTLEVLCGVGNILPVGIAIAIAYLTIEVFHIPSFNDTVIEAKTEAERAGKTALVVETELTVEPDAFAIGHEVHNILWPPTCTVLRIDKSNPNSDHLITEGDVLHLHYQTFDPDQTMYYLEQLLGHQVKKAKLRSHVEKKNEEIPSD